jgi:hypothetical protein
MFKRLTWLTIGVAMGLGLAIWLRMRVRRTVERYRPAAVVDEFLDAARGFAGDVRIALREGRETMRATEAGLRAERIGRLSPRGEGERAPSVPMPRRSPRPARRRARRTSENGGATAYQ